MKNSWLEINEDTEIEDGQLCDVVGVNEDTGEPERMADMIFIASDSEFFRDDGRGISSHVHMMDVTHYQVVELPSLKQG